MRNDRASVLETCAVARRFFPRERRKRGMRAGAGVGVGVGAGVGAGVFRSGFFPDAEGGDLIARFMRMAKANAATTARVSGMEEVPRAAAEWLRGRGAAPRMVCAGDLAELDWGGAGIAAECRGAVDGDEAGATRIVAAAADTGAMLQASDSGHSLTLSLLPPLHLAALRAEDIWPTWTRCGRGCLSCIRTSRRGRRASSAARRGRRT